MGFLVLPFSGQMDTSQAKAWWALAGPVQASLNCSDIPLLSQLDPGGLRLQAALVGLIPSPSLAGS